MEPKIVVIGTSWGGLYALRGIAKGLPADFAPAVVVVQHRHRDSEQMLEELLQDCSALPVEQVEDKAPIACGRIHVAPPNYHLLVEGEHFSLTTEAPVRFSRPSIDVTFASVADTYGAAAVGVVLTGANDDGSLGLRRIADRGGRAVVQDPATAESPTMPRAALRAVPDASVVPLEELAAYLVRLAAPAAGAPLPPGRPA